MKYKILILLVLVMQNAFAGTPFTNVTDPDTAKSKYDDWYNKDPKQDKTFGVSTDKAYQKILKGRKSKPVIVAIIDSGVDVEHEDLKGKIWVNEDEIPGNGIDDDKNGYIDDVHGWNFLGNNKGENIEQETLELTRLYKKYNEQFGDRTEADIKPEEKEEFLEFQKVKEEYEAKEKKAVEENTAVMNISMVFDMLKEYLKKDTLTVDDVKTPQTDNKELQQLKDHVLTLFENGITPDMIAKYKEHYDSQLKYNLNPDFNPRTIIGDDPENVLDSLYGNNNVEGPASEHGTHVAGIIGAVRGNNVGVKGIADNVKLMVLRAVPDGDERDKDIANAIKYAVNNGAQVINMSFGKGYSPQKEAVDAALQLAERKGVLLVHAAGNDAENIDTTSHFPNNTIASTGKPVSNWITVGASSIKANEEFPGYFSNYGKKTVDIFAPGVNVYSLKPENKYALNSGTSMACPVVSGVAALVLSYYPTLTAQQVKEILLQSSLKYKNLTVNLPSEDPSGKSGEKVKVKFEELSSTGGLINAYEALKLADKYSKSKHKIIKN